MSCEVCGWMAAFGAMISFGSFAVPIKSEAAKSVDVDPLVFQSYKTAMCFITSWLILLTGEKFHFHPLGILSGLFWVPGGVATIYAVKAAGLAIGMGIGCSCIVLSSFSWGIFFFQEKVHSITGACFAVLCLMIGIFGMSYFSTPENKNGSSNKKTIISSIKGQSTSTIELLPTTITRGTPRTKSLTRNTPEKHRHHDSHSHTDFESIDLSGRSNGSSSLNRSKSATTTTSTTKSPSSSSFSPSALVKRGKRFFRNISDKNGDEPSSDEIHTNMSDNGDDMNDLDDETAAMLQIVNNNNNNSNTDKSPINNNNNNEQQQSTTIIPMVHICGYNIPKREWGIFLAGLFGLYGGSIMAPMKLAPKELQGRHFLLSFAIGATIVNITLWIIRYLYNSYIYKSFIKGYIHLPSFHIYVMWRPGAISGMLWSIGNFFSLISVFYLGQGVGYPLVQSQMLVAGIWGIFYFKEVQGLHKILKWLLSSCITLFGILLLSYEHVDE